MQDFISYHRKLTGYKYQTTRAITCDLPLDLFPTLGTGGKIQTEGSYIILHLDLRTLGVRKGYCWDGPSGPTWDTPNFMRGSLFHDAWYQLMREYGSYYFQFRGGADKLLQRMCIEDGMSSWRARWVYWGVKTFGARSAGG